MGMENSLAMMLWSLSPPREERASTSPETLEEMARLFREFDGAADGQITKPEIAALFEKLSLPATEDQLSNWMNVFAVDGGLSMPQLTALMVQLRIARDRAAVFDGVGAGRTSRPEMAAPLLNQSQEARLRSLLGPAHPFEELPRFKAAFDGVGAGRISGPELAAPFLNQGQHPTDPFAELPSFKALFDGFGAGRISGPELVVPFANQGLPARLRALLEKLGCADPDEELSRVMTMFDLDAHADGRISRAELAALFKNLGHAATYSDGRMSLPELAPLFEKLSNEATYGDERMSQPELAALFEKLVNAATNGDGRMSLPDLAALLEKLDNAATNGDGRISLPDLAALFEKLDNAATDVEMGPMMAETDGDGSISFDDSVVVTVDTEAGTSDGSISFHDSVVITIDAEPAGTSNGSGAMRASGAEDNNVEDDRTRKLVWTVGILCAVSDSLAPAAAMYTSPRGVVNHGSDLAYRVCIASIAVTGVANMLAAVWVSGPQAPFARATARKILYVCIFTLMLSIALEGVAIMLRICD